MKVEITPESSEEVESWQEALKGEDSLVFEKVVCLGMAGVRVNEIGMPIDIMHVLNDPALVAQKVAVLYTQIVMAPKPSIVMTSHGQTD